MNRIFTTTTTPKDVLIVGFDNYSYILLNEQTDLTYYKFREFDSSFKAFRWLEETKNNPPAAIICNYEYLRDDDFRLLDTIRQHEELKYVPFIAIANDRFDMDISKALKMGIDDCYTEPVRWNDLQKRIEFLTRFKKDLLTNIGEDSPSYYTKKTPTGKRIFDIVLASSILLVFSPVLLIIAICIKLESGGPVIYRSKRIGQGYQAFDFLKFRSMCQDADAKLKKIAHMNQYSEEGNASFIKIKNDPRITRIGRIIRKTSLDEIPQLFNVLKGEMSIVGNRPLPLYEAELITRDAWAGRFLAPAGITGLWQVAPGGKENLSEEERIGLDIEYAKKLSFWMDLKIMSRTLPAMIQKGE